jgi:hypothetical protein
MRSEVVNLATTKQKYVDIVNKTLANPEQFTLKSMNCIEEIVTYNDGQSTNRAVAAIKSFID